MTQKQNKLMMFGNRRLRKVALAMFVLSSTVCSSQEVTGGFVSPPKQFIHFIDDDFAASFGRSSGGGCDLNLLSRSSKLEWGSTGKWKVYAINEKTRLYEKEENFSRSSNIDFGTEMFVAEVGKSMLKVEFVDRRGSRSGWVEACDVLMWSRPIARNGGFPKRVVALSQLDRSGEAVRVVATNFLKAPRRNSQRAALITGLDILYIMKEVVGNDGQTYFLLSGSANSGDLSNDLKGWIPSNQVTAWDTRVAYWENHSGRAQDQYGTREIPLFYLKDDLSKFLRTGAFNQALTKTVLKPRPESLNRMLHLESSWNGPDRGQDDLLELYAVMNSSDSSIPKGEWNEELDKWTKRLKKFNIHFVIDATASMEKNVPAIRAGLNDFMHELTSGSLKSLLTKIDLSVGASVYRGIEDSIDVYNLVVEPMKIADQSGIDAFNQKINSIEFKSAASDYTLEESMFWGISEALLDANFEQGATNFLIVIGDAGDDGKSLPDEYSITRTDISELLKQKDVDLLVLQSTNGYHQAFDGFVQDALFLIDDLESEDADLVVGEEPSLPNWTFISTGNANESSLKNEGLLCVNTNTGNKLEPSILGKIIADKIDSAAVRNFVRQKEFRLKMKDGTPIPEDYWPPGVPRAEPDQEYSVKAWANRTYYGVDHPAFEPYVYMENDVFEELKRDISKMHGLNTSAYYKELERFLTKYASKILGLGQSHPDVLDMSMAEVWEEAFELPFSYPNLAEVKIKEIQGLTTAASAGDVVKEEVRDFVRTCNRFSTIEKEDFKFNTSWGDDSENGGVVYWIPASQFPGMKP